MLAVSAEAKASAGAPCIICWARADDASKLNVALAFGLFCVKAVPISVNESFNDAAAKTVMSPDTAVAVVVGAAELLAPLSPPQAVTINPTVATRTRKRDGRSMRRHLSQNVTMFYSGSDGYAVAP